MSFGKKTHYTKHFLRSYLLNYGAALRGGSSEKTTQLEYQVAKMAISEMAMMLKDNIPMIKQYSGTLFNIYFVCDFVELHQALVKLDNKDNSHKPATRQDVISVLCTMDENPDLGKR